MRRAPPLEAVRDICERVAEADELCLRESEATQADGWRESEATQADGWGAARKPAISDAGR